LVIRRKELSEKAGIVDLLQGILYQRFESIHRNSALGLHHQAMAVPI
jgi:hypothetical protein